MFSFRISFKLVLIIAISLSGMMIMGPVALSTMRGQMMADRQAKTRQMIDVSYGIVAHYHQLESDGKLSREQAQAAAMGEIRDLRYDKVEYFFIQDMTPTMLMHPIKPELEGKQLGRRSREAARGRLLQLSLAETRLREPGREDFLCQGLCAVGLDHRHRHLPRRC